VFGALALTFKEHLDSSLRSDQKDATNRKRRILGGEGGENADGEVPIMNPSGRALKEGEGEISCEYK